MHKVISVFQVKCHHSLKAFFCYFLQPFYDSSMLITSFHPSFPEQLQMKTQLKSCTCHLLKLVLSVFLLLVTLILYYQNIAGRIVICHIPKFESRHINLVTVVFDHCITWSWFRLRNDFSSLLLLGNGIRTKAYAWDCSRRPRWDVLSPRKVC